MNGFLTWDRLRLIFLREGKVAAQAWPRSSEEMPAAVRQHLTYLLQGLGDILISLDEEHRDSLMSLFLAGAKRARTESSRQDSAHPDMSPAAIAARLTAERGEAFDDSLWQISDDTQSVVEDLVANPGAAVTIVQAMRIYGEIGRLCGPLWVSGTPEGFPELPDQAINALTLTQRVEMVPFFNEHTYEYEQADPQSIDEALTGKLVEEINASRERFYYGRDTLAALPSDPIQRDEEIRRRAEFRESIFTRTEAAVDSIVRPILAARLEYIEGLRAAEQEATDERERLEAEQQSAEDEARAAAGFEKPAPQRYGVSPRGAEFWVADALRWLGVHDAEVTQQSNDGGVDVLSKKYAVSVKHYTGSVPVEEIREIFGVAAAARLTPMLWTSGTLTTSASQFAELAPVGVIRYDVGAGTWEAQNTAGHDFLMAMEEGLGLRAD